MRNTIITIARSTMANFCARLLDGVVVSTVTCLTSLCGSAQFLLGWLNGSRMATATVMVHLHHKRVAVGTRRTTKTTPKDFGSSYSARPGSAVSRF